MKLLCAKETASMLGISERSAQRLMRAGEISAIRVGPKLWRTTPGHVSEYVSRQFERYRRAVTDLKAV